MFVTTKQCCVFVKILLITGRSNDVSTVTRMEVITAGARGFKLLEGIKPT